MKCFKLGIIDWNPDSKESTNKDLTMANFKDFINHEEVNLSRAVKVDNGVGTLQGLTRDKISDSLVARVRYNKSNDHFEIDARRDLPRSIFKKIVATLQAKILTIK